MPHDSSILAELAGLFQLALTKKQSHAEIVTETRGKTEHAAALKVSFCKSYIFPLFVEKKSQGRKMNDDDYRHVLRRKELNIKKKEKIINGNKDRNRITSNRLLPRILIIVYREKAIKNATINMPHTWCAMSVLSFS